MATTAVAFVDLGPFSVVAALAIAVCKMLLVALFFMHVRHSTRLTRLVVLGGLLWLGILLAFTLARCLQPRLARRPGQVTRVGRIQSGPPLRCRTIRIGQSACPGRKGRWCG